MLSLLYISVASKDLNCNKGTRNSKRQSLRTESYLLNLSDYFVLLIKHGTSLRCIWKINSMPYKLYPYSSLLQTNFLYHITMRSTYFLFETSHSASREDRDEVGLMKYDIKMLIFLLFKSDLCFRYLNRHYTFH